MNLQTLPSMLELQRGKSLKSKLFMQNQSQMNGKIKRAQKNNNYYVQAQQVIGLSKLVKLKKNSLDYHNQGKLLEQQLKLQHLETEYGIQKSRIEDQNNAKTFRIRYPYGKENVKITGDVLEKYSLNTYQNQSEVLKRFEDQAKKLKLSKSSERLQSNIRIEWQHQNNYPTQRQDIRKKTSILQRQKNKLYQTKRKYLKEGSKKNLMRQQQNRTIQNGYLMQKHNQLRKEQNRRLESIEVLLKDMRQKMDQNISCLTEKQHDKRKQARFIRCVDQARQRRNKLDFIGEQQGFERRNIPVVVYDKKMYNEKNYFARHIATDIGSLQRSGSIQKPEQYNQVLKVYNLNKIRLDRLCQRVSVKGNKSNFIY